jgi:histidyl-tRNA synthetase
MAKKFEGIRGMPDILPMDTPRWRQFEKCLQRIVAAYGYEEIRLPILEPTGLFTRSIGELTDIVEKEMYTFHSLDGKESLTLRPEATAGCVRAGIEHGLLYHQVQRLWCMGPMFRYERPQKGRYRQFHHVDIEAFGMHGPDIEVEHILMMSRLWRELGVTHGVTLQVNSLGTLASRNQYREKLVAYLSKYQQDLDEDSQRRLQSNPLRILDSKNPSMAHIIAGAPKCNDYLDVESKQHFEEFLAYLSEVGVSYVLNPNLVRGLDYYNRTVYEWVTDKLGAQGTICAGGRYDGLVEELGGDATPSVGFAIGIERVLLLQQALLDSDSVGVLESNIDVCLLHTGGVQQNAAMRLAEKLRDEMSTLRLWVHCGLGNLKQQFKKADKSGAKIALILGEAEHATNTLGIKFLRETRDQQSISSGEVTQFLTTYLGRQL